MDLDEIVEHIGLPNDLCPFSLDPETGEVTLGSPGDPYLLPTLSQAQISGWMIDFCHTFPDPRMQKVLQTALHHLTPSRRFDEVLSVNPAVREAWNRFHREQRRMVLMEWLKDR